MILNDVFVDYQVTEIDPCPESQALISHAREVLSCTLGEAENTSLRGSPICNTTSYMFFRGNIQDALDFGLHMLPWLEKQPRRRAPVDNEAHDYVWTDADYDGIME